MALGYLHSNNLIYRDLTPENILMGDDGYICLSEIENIANIDQFVESEIFIGSPEYIGNSHYLTIHLRLLLAPDILAGLCYSRATDWWTFGIVIYEMLVGVPPFYHHNQDMMLQLIAHSEVKFPSQISISDEVKNLIILVSELFMQPSKLKLCLSCEIKIPNQD